MSEITTIGLDLAKHVFQVHGIDAEGTTVLRKRLRRGQVLAFFSRLPRCVVGLEACATAHYWARELGALGHEVRLMPAQYVKARRLLPTANGLPTSRMCGQRRVGSMWLLLSISSPGGLSAGR
jgi:transposase